MGRGSWSTWVQRAMQDRKQKDKQAATERRACGCIVFLLLRRGRGGVGGGGGYSLRVG